MSCLGIDVGGTKVAFRIERNGRRPYQDSFRWPAVESAEQDLNVLARRLDRARAEWAEPIDFAGVALPATMDSTGRVVTWPGRPAWVGVDLAGALAEMIPTTTVRWGDDGDLAALAEARAMGLADAVYLGVGTGIGGGAVVAGELLPVRGSVEIGHMVVERGGPRCDCGRQGCLQAVASGPATLRRAEQLSGSPVEFADFRSALDQRRSWAMRAVGETWDALAVAVVSLDELLHTSAAVIGGGFADGLPGFAAGVAARAGQLARPGHPAPPVRPAALGGLSSLHGAVLLARRQG